MKKLNTPIAVANRKMAYFFNIHSVQYFLIERRCLAFIKYYGEDGVAIDQEDLILWEGDAYDDAGQFTDKDVENKALELLTKP